MRRDAYGVVASRNEGGNGAKNRGWGSRILGVFVEQTSDAATATDAPLTADPVSIAAEVPIAPTDILPPPDPPRDDTVVAEPREREASASLLDVDTATLYERGGALGDPNTDPLLDAYASMATTLDRDELSTAMDAMIRAVHANCASVSQTLVDRAMLLDIASSQLKKAVDDEVRVRASDLDALRQTTATDIAELDQRIASLKETLAQREQDARRQDAEALGSLTGFDERIAREKARLDALREFLATKVPSPAEDRPT